MFFQELSFSFSHDGFIARSKLAVIDHNHHLARKPSVTKAGKVRYNRSWSKRRQAWKLVALKEEKSYSHDNYLMARTLFQRVKDKKCLKSKLSKPESHPEKIAPNIGKVAAPSVDALRTEYATRF